MKNKENTKRRLLDAVGDIIKKSGTGGLGVNKVAKKAGVSKILIYRYFGNLEQLIKTYVLEKDFWTNYKADPYRPDNASLRENIGNLLLRQFSCFYNHCEMEAALINSISNADERLNLSANSYAWNRQQLSAKQPPLSDEATYFNIISMLLQAGTNHLLLGTHGGYNNKNEKVETADKIKLLRSIVQIVDWTIE